MSKKVFIEDLNKKTNLGEEKCNIINDILEDNFIVGKKNKERIVEEIMDKLEMDYDEADNIYNDAMEIIANRVVDKIKHPFKSED